MVFGLGTFFQQEDSGGHSILIYLGARHCGRCYLIEEGFGEWRTPTGGYNWWPPKQH